MNLTSTLRALPLLLGLAGACDAATAPHLLLLDGAVVGTDVVVVGERGTILRSSDQGVTWTDCSAPVASTLTAVSFAPGSPQGWAVGHDALILATNDGGRTWQKQWQGDSLQDSFLDVVALDARRVIAVGAYGLFASTADGGKTWQRRRIAEGDYHLNRLTRGPSDTLYLAGEHGTLLHSHDAGATWQPIDSPYDGSFYGILPLSSSTLLAHGLRGRIYRSTDEGQNWTLVPNEQRALIATALELKNGALLFAGQARAWFVSRDRGLTIAPWPAPVTTAMSKLLQLPNGTLLALGEAGVTLLPAP